jgi:hypothetical protein
MRAGFPKEFVASDRRGEIFTRLSDAEAGGAGGIGFPSFNLPLNDLGNGIVNTVPAQSAGSPTATFTRASVAWTKLPSGLWGQVATGIARATYLGRDTAVGQYGGYWSEPAGVQLVPTTAAIRDMRDASWVAVGITPTLTATGIDGVPNACTTLTCTAPNGTILQTLVAAASSRTNSAFVRRRTGSGAILLKQGTATQDITASLSSVIFTRPQLNDNELNVAYGFQMATIGDQIDVDTNQFEALIASEFASSPMPATGASRAGDRMDFATAGNIDFTQGTAYAELSTNYTASSAGRYAIATGFTARILGLATSSQVTEMQIFDGTTSLAKTGLSSMNTAARKRAGSWGAGGQFVTGDGAAPTNSAFDGAMGAGANLEIGHDSGANQWNGTIKNLRIYPTQLSNAQLQALTA